MNSNFKEKLFLFFVIFISILTLSEFSKILTIYYPDEQFQTIEMGGKLVYSYGWKSWEWFIGIRSYFVPFFYSLFIKILSFLKIQYGSSLIYSLKFLTGCFVFLSYFFSFIKFYKTERNFSIFGIVLYFIPALLYFSTTTFSDTLSLAAVFLLFSSLYYFEKRDSKQKFWITFFLTSLIFIRFQNILFLFYFILVALKQRNMKALKPIYLGIILSLFLQGLTDWVTYSYPFQSSILNVYYNFFKNVASMNGVSPYYYYFQQFFENFGIGFTLISFSSFIYQSFYKKNPFFITGLFFFLVHCCIPHKEFRFIFPIIPFLIFSTLLSIQDFKNNSNSLSFFKRDWSLIVTTFLIIISIPIWKPLSFANHFDLSEMTFIAGDFFRKMPVTERKLLIIDHFWVWTRGELGLGTAVQFKEIKSDDLNDFSFKDYSLIIVGRRLPQYTLKEINKNYDLVYEDPYFRQLYKRKIY